MKLKKLLAAVTATAVAVTAFSVTTLTAYPSLLPLKDYDVKGNISGFSSEELKAVPIRTVLDSLTYNESVDIDGDGSYDYAYGDPVNVPEDAVSVWVDGDEYSIYDQNASIDLYDELWSYSDSYYSDYKIIVGSGKQLDPDNVIYNASLYITKNEIEPVYDVKIYSLGEDGVTKNYEAIGSVDLRSYSSYEDQDYVDIDLERKLVKDEKLYVEIESNKLTHSGMNDEIPADFSYRFVDNYGNDIDNSVTVSNSLYRSSGLNMEVVFSKPGTDSTVAENQLYKRFTYLYIGGCRVSPGNSLYTDGKDISYWSKTRSAESGDNYADWVETRTLPESYPADGEYDIQLSTHYYPSSENTSNNIRSKVKMCVVGRYDSMAEAEAAGAVDIKSEAFTSSYNGGYHVDFSKGDPEFTIFIDPTDLPNLVEPNEDGTYPDYVVHYKLSLKNDKYVPKASKATYNVDLYTLDANGNKQYLEPDSRVDPTSTRNVPTSLSYSFDFSKYLCGQQIYADVTGDVIYRGKTTPADAELQISGDSVVASTTGSTTRLNCSAAFVDRATQKIITSCRINITITGLFPTLNGTMTNAAGTACSSDAALNMTAGAPIAATNTFYFGKEELEEQYKYKLASGELNITKVVLGKYSSSAEAAAAEDITAAVLGDGYSADFRSGVDMTAFADVSATEGLSAFAVNGSELVLNIHSIATRSGDEPAIADTTTDTLDDKVNAYFKLDEITNENGDLLNTYIPQMEYIRTDGALNYLDSYYMYKYQTAFILDDDTPYSTDKLRLNVLSPDGIKVYNSITGSHIKLGEVPQDFTGGSLKYTVAATAGQGNYTVRVAEKHNGGAKLFVNGPSEREVFFNSYYGDYHDILVANIGDAELTGLKAELTNAQNMKLDGYWNVGGEKNDTLAPFTSTTFGEMTNLAKIRLVPDGEGDGEVSGTLTISADGQEPVVITIKGRAGNPQIITQATLDDGVKFVPYFTAVSTNNMYDWNHSYFSVIDGELPEGVELDMITGEFNGVPQETGSYDFSVEASFSASDFEPVISNFHIDVLENTNANVYNATDADYDLLTPIGNDRGRYLFQLSKTDEDQLFVSKGEYGEFRALWINGEEMIPDEDYTSESGSTRITIKAQTITNKFSKDKANTIAAEFRVNGTNVLKRTAQNVSIGNGGNNGGNNGGSGSGGGGGSHGHGSGNELSLTPSLADSSATGWDAIAAKLKKMTSGSLEIDMNGSSLLPSEIPDIIKGKDITLIIKSEGTMEINGLNIKNVKNTGVDISQSAFESDPLSSVITDYLYAITLTVDNSGEFGYTGTLVIPLGPAYAGNFANLYSVDRQNNANCIAAAKIGADGTARFNITSGGKFIVVADTISRRPGDADDDTKITANDALLLLKHAVGLETLPTKKKWFNDMDGSGAVDIYDALLVLKYYVGIN